ncbi:hypothetical protein Tco_1199602, partial [Tanacetum coccineum]
KFNKIASPTKKQTLVLEEEPVKKPKRPKQSAPAKKDKKAPATTDRSKGIDLLSEAALLEDAKMKKVLKWSKRGDDDDSNDDDSDDDSDDDGGDNDSDNERTESDEDENPNLN